MLKIMSDITYISFSTLEMKGPVEHVESWDIAFHAVLCTFVNIVGQVFNTDNLQIYSENCYVNC